MQGEHGGFNPSLPDEAASRRDAPEFAVTHAVECLAALAYRDLGKRAAKSSTSCRVGSDGWAPSLVVVSAPATFA